MNISFWKDKKVLVTGHTGFKGSWLSLWLQLMQADVKGYALEPPTTPSLFDEAQVGTGMLSEINDVTDLDALQNCLLNFKPEIIFHLAAQPLVRQSYQLPLKTYATNVMGTANLLETVRNCDSVAAVVVVTSDKCYENRETLEGYKESDPLGGYDPYSNSKACAELVTASFRSSFFNPQAYSQHGIGVASARAGNVIGGGDWAEDRLIPDMLKAFSDGEAVVIRAPGAIRPWQYILDLLCGYLMLAENLYTHGADYAEPWNFGPNPSDFKPVSWITDKMADYWGENAKWQLDNQNQPHETTYLSLDCSKARRRLQWTPRCKLETALRSIIHWHREWSRGQDIRAVTLDEIQDFMAGLD